MWVTWIAVAAAAAAASLRLLHASCRALLHVLFKSPPRLVQLQYLIGNRTAGNDNVLGHCRPVACIYAARDLMCSRLHEPFR